MPVGCRHARRKTWGVWQAINTNLTQAEPDARCARTAAALTTPTAINSVQQKDNFT